MTKANHFPVLAAALFGATGVGIGALGTHALEPTLDAAGMMHAWDTATRYQMFHALALLGVGAWVRTAAGVAENRALWAARWWTFGTILFSGSLYGLALGGPGARWLGPVTPVGGVLLILGWCYLLAAAWGSNTSD